MFDAIVIGARCAGSPTAMHLAKKGYKVLVVDRDTFPSDTVSTHALTGDSVPRLQSWGLMNRILATGLKPLKMTTFRAFGMAMENPYQDPLFGLNPRRYAIDTVLVEAAREAGAEVREGVSVQELLFERDTVVGIKGRQGTTTFEERAKIVVGADGKNSIVAKTMKPAEYNTHPGTTAFTPTGAMSRHGERVDDHRGESGLRLSDERRHRLPGRGIPRGHALRNVPQGSGEEHLRDV
jgi:flavin-dependent dehydrogenase